MLDVLQALFQRAGALCVFVAPWPLLSALAGATGMSAWLFFPVATAGQAIWMVISYRIGEALSEFIAPIMDFVREHMLSTTLACIGLVLVYRWVRRRRGNQPIDMIAQVEAATQRPEGSPAVQEGER
jgi:membrane protein DedA with SNARE-associated domain